MKYLEIKKIIAERAARTLPSQRLPGFRQLMTEFNVSQSTVSKALDLLEAEGIIFRNQGGRIMAASSKRSITIANRKRIPETNSHTILFSYAAYYSGGLWCNLNTVELCAHARHANLLFHKRTADTTMEEFVEYVKSQKHLTGVIYSPSSRKLTDCELALLGSLNSKVVIFNAQFHYRNLPENVFCIMPDELAAGKLLAEHLMKLGHFTPGFIHHAPKTDANETFFRGIRSRYQQHGHPIPDSSIFRAGTLPWENALAASEATVRDHISTIRNAKISSLIFSSSDGAIAAIRALRENGFRVPEDIGIAGHGDMPLYQYMPDVPAIVCFDYTESAGYALDFILKRTKPDAKTVLLKPLLKPYNGIQRKK